jgi:predicted TIM-barrel fold metal-dependent hydrolase
MNPPPTMRIVDPHVHFWSLGSGRYAWLLSNEASFLGPAAGALRRDVLPIDLLRAAAGLELDKVVHVEAKYDASRPVDETRWLQQLAAEPSHRGLPQAVVAAVDLAAPDARAVLQQHAQFAAVRGVRQILNVHADPLYDYVGVHWMRDARWQANFSLLRRFDFSFDLQIYPSQAADAAALARRHPDIQFVLNHAGMFVDRGSVAGYRAWREGLEALAGCPNVAVKISGFAMFTHSCAIEVLRPYVLQTLDAFGVERAMFASNAPIDPLFGSYADIWSAYSAIVSGASPSERNALFAGNAERIYRL